MEYKIGEKWLITCNAWFYAPNGRQYRAVHGTIIGIKNDEATLGVKTNRNATNWYMQIGSAVIAGCQIHYAVRSDSCEFGDADGWNTHEGKIVLNKSPSVIFNADA